MATITKRETAAGKTKYKADIRIKKAGRIIHRESRTFDRKKLAEEWAKKRELELQDQSGLEKVRHAGTLIGDVIEQYEELFKPVDGWGRSKGFDMARLKTYKLAEIPAVAVTSQDLIEHVRWRISGGVSPATVNNDLIWLGVIFKAVRAAKGIPLDLGVIEDARVICRQHKLISRSEERERRPTPVELWKLSRYFWRKQYRDRRNKLPMLDIMWFQIYSSRRIAETCRLRWDDNNNERQTGMVRDAKHPVHKKGNHKRFKYARSAWKIVQRQLKDGEYIFPYNPKSVSHSFARACTVLGIEDLHLHDLRHDATSRLFEAGYGIEQVQLFTLHEDWKTLKRYTHLKPEDLA